MFFVKNCEILYLFPAFPSEYEPFKPRLRPPTCLFSSLFLSSSHDSARLAILKFVMVLLFVEIVLLEISDYILRVFSLLFQFLTLRSRKFSLGVCP
jgi:hypothetical protein